MKIPDRIIVVDDDPTANMLCKIIIRKAYKDMELKLFTNPELALKIIEEKYNEQANIPTVLLLDINMPIMSGWEFLDVFKHYNEKIQGQFIIFLLSSSLDHRDKERAESNALVSGFISKPLRVEDVKRLFYF